MITITNNPPTNVIVFDNVNKIVCSGAHSEEDSKQGSKNYCFVFKRYFWIPAARKIVQLLKEFEYQNLSFDVKLENIVVNWELGYDVDLNMLHLENYDHCTVRTICSGFS